MYYLMITSATLLFSLQFMFNSGYQKEEGHSLSSALKFSVYTSIFGMIALFIINGFKLELSGFSIACAVVYSFVNIILSYSTVKAFHYANLSVYSVFSMIGGMLLPFIYGLFCGEELKITRIICCLLITFAVILGTDIKDNKTKKALKYYIAVFIFNGMVGVISKYHQSSPLCVDSGSFMILTKIFTFAVSVLMILIFLKDKSFKISPKSTLLCAGNSVFNSVGNLLLLIALLHLPASVQYPIVTGGVIVFAVLIDIIRKEKVTKKEFISAAIAFAASALMAL